MPIILDGTLGITTPALTVTGATVNTGGISTAGNLTFTSTGNRITGDFSNATEANRVLFQASGTNSSTNIGAIPSGTNVNSNIIAYNSSTTTNASKMRMGINSTAALLVSDYNGSGTYLPLAMYTGGSERMRIDTSGNVGIGTASPVSVGGYGALTLNGTTGSLLYLQTNASSAMQIATNASGASITAIGASLPLYFSTNSTERMRIDANGGVLVGTTTSYGKLGVHNAAVGTGGVAITTTTSNDTYYAALFKNSAASNVGNINCTTSTTAYVTSSDYRLKENIKPMTGALDTVAKLKPVKYNWKIDGSDGQGFIAHELAEICPQAVSGEKDAVDEEGKPNYQGIDTSFLVATLVAAIQELKAEVDSLKQQLGK